MNGRKNLIVLSKIIRLVEAKLQFGRNLMGCFPFTLKKLVLLALIQSHT